MNEQDLCKKRFLDLSRQADRKGIVMFSDFLNLNEQNIYHQMLRELDTPTRLFGGYDGAERQMIAFIPDALMFEWDYPIACICARPSYRKFAEALTHRDLLGSLMHLGIERSTLGDIICKDDAYYIFCQERILPFIMDQLTKVKHTLMTLTIVDQEMELDATPEFDERQEMVASNRIDAIIAKAYHLSRSEASEHLFHEQVFLNGRCITNCNTSCETGDIVSVRGKGRFIFETNQTLSKKGKLRINLKFYK